MNDIYKLTKTKLSEAKDKGIKLIAVDYDGTVYDRNDPVYNSLEKVIDFKGKNLPIVFRTFLKRYYSYFEEGYSLLDGLNNESIEYVVGSLQFDKNLNKYKRFLPKYYSNETQ